MSALEEFNYDEEANYQVNFDRWYTANCIEREIYKEEKMNFDEAEITFRKMWGFKQLNEKVFINQIMSHDKKEKKIQDEMDRCFERNLIYLSNAEYQIVYEALCLYVNNENVEKTDEVIEETYFLIEDIETKIDVIFLDIQNKRENNENH